MKQLHLDLCGGIAGDMFLGLLLDIGLSQEQLQTDLKSLQLPGWQLRIARESRLGISGTRVEVLVDQEQPPRNWRDIDRLLATSALPTGVGEKARRVFRRLGETEARIHATSLEEVHFHEVGALDALIDIVGTVAGLERLGVEQITAGSVPLGFGSNRCAHGNYPLPAPATLELLLGWPVYDAACDRELVTPTGAALLATLARPAPLPELNLERVGYGVGGWELNDRPNLLRGLLGGAATALLRDEVVELETQVDDANPEWLGQLMEDLLQQGALDVSFAPLQMKKQRPGTLIRVLAPPQLEQELATLILFGSGSSGVRSRRSRRYKLQRRQEQIDTPLGPARIKLFLYRGRPVRITAEFESCRELARRHQLSLPEVYRQVEQVAAALLHQQESQSQEPS